MQDSLRSLLHEWEVKPVLDPNFQAAVWRRITVRKQRLSYRIWNRTEAFVSQPVWAAVVVAVLLFVGAASGNAWQKYEARHERVAGLSAYVLAVNPVAHAAGHRR